MSFRKDVRFKASVPTKAKDAQSEIPIIVGAGAERLGHPKPDTVLRHALKRILVIMPKICTAEIRCGTPDIVN